MTQGDQDASVEMIEYASFTCPHCAKFHSDVYPELKANYIDKGLLSSFIERCILISTVCGHHLWLDVLVLKSFWND